MPLILKPRVKYNAYVDFEQGLFRLCSFMKKQRVWKDVFKTKITTKVIGKKNALLLRNTTMVDGWREGSLGRGICCAL